MLCVSFAAGAILLCGVLLVLLMRYQHTSTVRPQDQYVGQIPAFYSTVDADGDGVDDQTDMLDNALAYVDTRPKYITKGNAPKLNVWVMYGIILYSPETE